MYQYLWINKGRCHSFFLLSWHFLSSADVVRLIVCDVYTNDSKSPEFQQWDAFDCNWLDIYTVWLHALQLRRSTPVLVLSRAWDLVQDVNIIAPIENSNCNDINFSICVKRKEQNNAFWFQERVLCSNEGPVRSKLKRRIKRVRSLQGAWKWFKTTPMRTEQIILKVTQI